MKIWAINYIFYSGLVFAGSVFLAIGEFFMFGFMIPLVSAIIMYDIYRFTTHEND